MPTREKMLVEKVVLKGDKMLDKNAVNREQMLDKKSCSD